MRWSIRYRLLAPLALLLLGVIGISTWSAIAAARQAEERIAAHVRRVTHTLAGASISLTPRILEQMKGLSGADYLFEDADGNRMTTLSSTQLDLPPQVLHQTATDDSEQLGMPVAIDGHRFRCRRLPQRAGGNLFILYPEASLNEAIRDAAWPALVFGLFGGSVAVALMYWIGQRLVRRIRDLERRTRQIAGGDFSPMPLPSANDELRDLSQSVNEMAERLAKYQDTIRTTEQWRLLGQLSGGLAHQLRNAVTGAKLAIQVYLQEAPQPEPEGLHVALRQLNLMEANLRRFLAVGKSEAQPRSRCSITELIDDALSLLRPQASHAGVEVRWQRPQCDWTIEGNANQLRDAFLNLIGNAIEAAGAHGVVAVTAASEDKASALAIEIADTGPGPPPEIAARLFEPFVTGKPEGIGLGLAVAQHAASMHGGKISWRRESGKTVFRVALPAVLVT